MFEPCFSAIHPLVNTAASVMAIQLCVGAFSISLHPMDVLDMCQHFKALMDFPVFSQEVISLNGALQPVPLKQVQLKQLMQMIREPCSAKSKTHTHAHTRPTLC